jgi:hypothetical protein
MCIYHLLEMHRLANNKNNYLNLFIAVGLSQ